MSEYVSDVLLLLSLLGAPIVLGMLLFYGLSKSDRLHHHEDGRRPLSPTKGDGPNGRGAAR